MILHVPFGETVKQVDSKKFMDLAMPLNTAMDAAKAWYVGPVKIDPVVIDDWIGSVRSGAPVNFYDIFFNPHGNGTHTECLGHISPEKHSVTKHIKDFFFWSELISIHPQKIANGDSVIALEDIQKLKVHPETEGLIIRTLPNGPEKLKRQYSNSNPPYLDHIAAQWLREQGIKHLLIDLPSVDREVDEGKLLAHHAFWNYPNKPRFDASITELVYVPQQIEDGLYFTNLSFPPFDNDASPSRPLIFKPID